MARGVIARTKPASRRAARPSHGVRQKTSTATVAAEPPSPEPVAEPVASATEPTEPPESGFVASLHLGDLGDSAPDPDATVSFDVAEFGYGEREEDVDIEEID